jgi:hypothetical protein
VKRALAPAFLFLAAAACGTSASPREAAGPDASATPTAGNPGGGAPDASVNDATPAGPGDAAVEGAATADTPAVEMRVAALLARMTLS